MKYIVEILKYFSNLMGPKLTSKRMSSFELSVKFLRDVLLGSEMPKCDDSDVFSLFNLLNSQVGDFNLL